VSPVFRHGRLRLYLLKLLDESPRHGYEVIRLLQDRFMGVYAPSPGTIYPRLARLEEEGLVTHDEVDGKKVYRITDKGREELRNRSDELRELEEEIGRGAHSWEPILSYYSSAGFTDERVHLFAATDLYEASADSEESERIEIVRWPLADLERAICECADAKTLIALMWLAGRLNVGLHAQGGTAPEAKPGG